MLGNVEWAIESFEEFYDCRMKIIVNKAYKHGAITKPNWVSIASGMPCRISKKQLVTPTASVDARVDQQVVLFCNPKVEILSGSRLEITNRYGETRNYTRSSEPVNNYSTHQEVLLVREVRP